MKSNFYNLFVFIIMLFLSAFMQVQGLYIFILDYSDLF
nr:MAG TPA: induced Fungus-induced protein [Caudoviricetes sp.]